MTDDGVERVTVREVCANGSCIKTTEVEAKLDEGNIQEAEAALRDGLSLNFEVPFPNSLSFNLWCHFHFFFALSKLLLLIYKSPTHTTSYTDTLAPIKI